MKKQCSLVVMVTILCAEVHTQAGAQTFTCDASLSTPLCPGTVATCTCNATGMFAQTRWVFTTLNLQCSSGPNYIALAQCAASSGTCGPYLSAANNIGSSCPTSSSTLNITASPSLNGLVVECRDLSSGSPVGTLVGTKNISVVASPGPVGSITLNSPSVDQLTVAWAPPTTGGVPTSYNVSINDSSNTLVPILANGPLQNTFTGLTSDTLYTVSVVAINCAGTSNVTRANRRTLAAPPASVQVVLVINPDNTSLQLNISWTPVGGSVTMYTVRVVTVGGGISVGQGYATCTSSTCLYVQNVTGFATNTSYYVFVASINGDGVKGPEISTIYASGTAPTAPPTSKPSSSPSPSPSPSPSQLAVSGSNIASIDTPTAVGITFAITFIISFSMGMLVASIILCVCYIPRVSSITTEASIPTTYEVVGINQKQTSTIELESNAAYGTAR